MHLAAESHADRSIHGPETFIRTNVDGTFTLLGAGHPGETYNIGGWNEQTNTDIVRTLCALLDELSPDPAGPFGRLITHVADRPGHGRR